MRPKLKPRQVTWISWVVTGGIVITLLVTAARWILPARSQVKLVPAFTPFVDQAGQPDELPSFDAGTSKYLVRTVSLRTSLPESLNYSPVTYTVVSGDSVFGIANGHNIKPETVLWANYSTLKDSPDSIRVGQVLVIPPVDGVYYEWQVGDTIDSVARKFEVMPDAILDWSGNEIDLTDPEIKPGSSVMIPGGEREFVQWLIPDVARGRSGTANTGGAACGDGPVGNGAFVWPADNHFLSGNDYWSGHLGIDIAAGEGASVFASDSGVVTAAAGGWNYGYGNYVMIDHGNGYITLYAHLSAINVTTCQGVSRGSLIGRAGNTGNSFGAHLHFEVRLNGGFINPWYVLP